MLRGRICRERRTRPGLWPCTSPRIAVGPKNARGPRGPAGLCHPSHQHAGARRQGGRLSLSWEKFLLRPLSSLIRLQNPSHWRLTQRGTRHHRLRQAAVATLGAVTAVSGIALLGGGVAGATVAPGTSLSAATVTTVIPGGAGQAAGNLVLSVPNNFATVNTVGGSSDQISLEVTPPTGGVATGNTIGFASAPTVTVTGGTPGNAAPTFTEALSTAPGSPLGTSNNVVTLTVTNTATHVAADANWTVTLGGVAYNVGTGVATGAVNVTATPANGQPGGPAVGTPLQPPAQNATITNYAVTGNNPSVGLQPSSTGAISNLVITEYQTGVVTGAVQATLSSGTFTATSTPTVTASGGGAVVGPVTKSNGNATLNFTVSPASTTGPATFTLSGLVVNAPAGTGPVSINVTGAVIGTAKAYAVIAATQNHYGQTAVDTSATLFENQGCPIGGNAV